MSVFAILYTVLVVYLGVYSYGNPDPPHCYYIDGLDTTGRSKAAVTILANDFGIPIRTGYPVDIAHLFRSWFLWGFWGSIAWISLAAVFLPFFILVKNKDLLSVVKITGMILGTLSSCSSIVWFILGFFWRFSRGGRTASGEKLERVANISDE